MRDQGQNHHRGEKRLSIPPPTPPPFEGANLVWNTSFCPKHHTHIAQPPPPGRPTVSLTRWAIRTLRGSRVIRESSGKTRHAHVARLASRRVRPRLALLPHTPAWALHPRRTRDAAAAISPRHARRRTLFFLRVGSRGTEGSAVPTRHTETFGEQLMVGMDGCYSKPIYQVSDTQTDRHCASSQFTLLDHSGSMCIHPEKVYSLADRRVSLLSLAAWTTPFSWWL